MPKTSNRNTETGIDLRNTDSAKTQECPVCRFPIGIVAGSHDAICHNCGFKDPCCE